MPITSSATKSARQSEVRRLRRQPPKTQMKTAMRAVLDLVKQGKSEEAVKALPRAYKMIDMAAKKFIIHRNNAARKKSMLAKMVGKK
jgi:small subunit ribosomal protein S20